MLQVDLSETVDSGNVSGDDVDDPDFEDSEEDGIQNSGIQNSEIRNSKDFDEFHVDLCHGCSNSLPLVNLFQIVFGKRLVILW